jgi:hypothetical protein
MEETLRVIKRMKADGVIGEYAIGGAIGAMFYVAPFATEDLDIFFSISMGGESIDILGPIYDYLQKAGYPAEGAMINIEGWPVQFLPVYNALIEEAVEQAIETKAYGIPVRVMQAEHLVAIMLQTGRPKDYARIASFLEVDAVDTDKLMEVLSRHGLDLKWQENRLRFS